MEGTLGFSEYWDSVLIKKNLRVIQKVRHKELNVHCLTSEDFKIIELFVLSNNNISTLKKSKFYKRYPLTTEIFEDYTYLHAT